MLIFTEKKDSAQLIGKSDEDRLGIKSHTFPIITYYVGAKDALLLQYFLLCYTSFTYNYFFKN